MQEKGENNKVELSPLTFDSCITLSLHGNNKLFLYSDGFN